MQVTDLMLSGCRGDHGLHTIPEGRVHPAWSSGHLLYVRTNRRGAASDAVGGITAAERDPVPLRGKHQPRLRLPAGDDRRKGLC